MLVAETVWACPRALTLSSAALCVVAAAVFVLCVQDEAQLIAADELCARGWWWHKKFRCWFIHAPNNPVVKNATARSERGTYLFFDTSIWDVVQVRGSSREG